MTDGSINILFLSVCSREIRPSRQLAVPQASSHRGAANARKGAAERHAVQWPGPPEPLAHAASAAAAAAH